MKANWGDWNLPASLCDFYLAMDVVCSTSSIFNLVAISLDRFLAVTSPILYSQHRHDPLPAYWIIATCWAASCAIGLPIMAGLNHRPENTTNTNTSYTSNITREWEEEEEEEQVICAFYNPDFIIWSSLGSFYIPCLVMITLYYRIFKVNTAGCWWNKTPPAVINFLSLRWQNTKITNSTTMFPHNKNSIEF